MPLNPRTAKKGQAFISRCILGNASTAWKRICIRKKGLFLIWVSISPLVFWPTVLEYVDELIKVLIEKEALFVDDSCFAYNIL